MIRIWRSIGLLIGLAVLAFSIATAGELDSKMEKVVRRFVEVCQGKIEAEATLAVFPFQADENLAKKKVDFAVGELLTQKLLQNGKFKLVERIQLQKMLDEQALGLSGAIESETAAKVGELLGARLAVLGGVSRLGKSYQIVIKLVDTASGQILAAEVQEVPVQVFDEEAAAYLALVPERQAIGLYLVYARGFGSSAEIGPQTYFGVTITPTYPMGTKGTNVMGIGVRYFPFQNWMMDLSVMREARKYSDRIGNESIFRVSGGFGGGNNIPTLEIKGVTTRLVFNRAWQIWDKFRICAGAGVSYFMPQETDQKAAISINMDDGTTVRVERLSVHLHNKGFTPLIRLGLEWKPQARFGYTLFCNYQGANDYRLIARMTQWGPPPQGEAIGEVDDITIYQYKYRFYIENSLSLYF